MSGANPSLNPSDDAVVRLLEARFHDPFSILGRHPDGDRASVRAFLPHVDLAEIVGMDRPMNRVTGDLFEWQGPASALPFPYRLRIHADEGTREFVDPYQFGPQLAESDLVSFNRGDHYRAHAFLGAHVKTVDGVAGVVFATWAPNAERVSVLGDFNRWDGRCHPMRTRGGSGVWELFLPGAEPGTLYKFEIRNRESGEVLVKSDPYARWSEVRPRTASIVVDEPSFQWGDRVWLERRRGWDWAREPISIYELHLGSWDRPRSGGFGSYRELADRLVPYLLETGFTHVELLPITEHPYDGSWGYQTTGYFAPTSRHGTPDDLRYLVDRLHQSGLGVFLDWVPGHFPRDGHGLFRFDGSALYEYGDTQKGEHAEWGTLVFNYARHEVLSFLISSALYWIEEFHFDGLRVDAVAAMLYLDYSRPDGGWTPNEFGGNENLEAIEFLKALNTAVHGQFPGAAVMAEESTAWPAVTRPTHDGGLGFTMKWNMGWMHDTLAYLGHDAIHRKYHHDLLSFGPVYVFTENFISPLSHDEVVHGKGSLLGKMSGDDWQQFANLRLLYTFQWTYPGKKLLFMGCEFAQREEWDSHRAIRWDLLNEPWHAGIRRLIDDLNRLYRSRPALFRTDFQSDGFVWLRWDDRENSVLSFIRRWEDSHLVVVLNFTPVPRENYRIGIPQQGAYREVINTDSRFYGGTDVGNPSPICSEPAPWMNQPFSMPVTLPPLGGIILERE